MGVPKTRKRKLTNLILFALEKTVDGYVRFEDFTYNPGMYTYGSRYLNKASLSKALKRLRENGFVELLSEEELILRLTDKGRERLIFEKMREVTDQKWDGKWRIVIFDIPENKRKARDLLRYHLKNWGFTSWQQSVWVSKRSCAELLRNYITQIGIEDWVLVIESDNIGR